MTEPVLIQGGMGIGVSGWPLARAVSRLGQLGVVSGTALDAVFIRRLQAGDPGGHLRRILRAFPVPELANALLARYTIPGGKADAAPFTLVPLAEVPLSLERQQLAVVASFAEVALAKEGHQGLVGINFLEKIQLPMLPSLYGAMLAGVDYILIGAGIPREIPGALDRLARDEPASLRVHVEGEARGNEVHTGFDPRDIVAHPSGPLTRPKFLAIIASSTLAVALARKATGEVHGFVIEGPTAGGHNAPPRGPVQLSARGEPVYGERDAVELEPIRELGKPFWLAGSYGLPERLREALAKGAAGVQVGTAFAFCRESGMDADLKARLLARARQGRAAVFTDPVASPAGFPFKVAELEGTLSEAEVYAARPRVCDLGYLRSVYRRPDGSLGYRCAGEPVQAYVAKGGDAKDAEGRKCLCNGLLATIGFAQRQRDGTLELPLVTAGDELGEIARFLHPGQDSYSAEDVVRALLGAG